MKNKIFIPLFIFFVAILTLGLNACKKDKPAEGIDKQLLDMAKESSGFTWYNNSNALLNKSSGSGHSQPFLRTRYNTIAATMLDGSGKITAGAVFPDGSLIVKELFSNSTDLGRYAILYKKASDANADANGWVWGYINADETVAEPAANKGTGCRGCHSQANSIDFMLMNAYFP